MYRRMYGHCNSSTNPSVAPRMNTSSSPSVSGKRRCRCYGPPKRPGYKSRRARDRHFWSLIFKDIVKEDEDDEKKKKEEKDKDRVPEEEVKKLKVLMVKKVNLHIRNNAFEHHTDQYHAVTKKDRHPVLRRGQEFKATITFHRPYKKEIDDLTFIFDADEDTPCKKLQESFRLDEEGKGTYMKDDEWGARIVKSMPAENKMELSIYIASNAIVGEWDLKVKTTMEGEEKDMIYEHSKPIIILFNPWSKVDQVHFTEDQKLLNEYVLNPQGTAYRGSSVWSSATAWTYGQFEEGILDICLSILRRAFCFKISTRMGDPVTVARALSKIVNDSNDQGVLVGNWSGNYEGGERPTNWKTSTRILKQYGDKGKPVKYGQCWVFSHVLTAVCRALGLPCRSVTNFDSAHDTDNSCTIDKYFALDGSDVSDMNEDSIWNFHVWNEAWMKRPDIPNENYHGWQVIDATPQEQSFGTYQCGPCPVKAIKCGDIGVSFDTGFVFSEVNADVVSWLVGPDKQIITHTDVDTTKVGSKIVTKYPDGKPYKKRGLRDPNFCLDLTHDYKFKEDTEEEREAVMRAARHGKRGTRLFKKSSDLEVKFKTDKETYLGEDLVVTSFVKNVSKEDKDVAVLMAGRTCTYWNNSRNDEKLFNEKYDTRKIKPGCQESYTTTLPYDSYMKHCDENFSVYVYTCATDVKENMPFSAQMPFNILVPEIDMEGPEEAFANETITVKVSITNPIKETLTDCHMDIEGSLWLAEDDPNNVESFFFVRYMTIGDIGVGQSANLTFRLKGEVNENTKQEIKDFNLCLKSRQLLGIKGSYTVTLKADPAAPLPCPSDDDE